MKKPCGPGTAVLFRKSDGSPLGYSAGLGDFNWYLGPVQSAPEEGIYDKKYRLNKTGGKPGGSHKVFSSSDPDTPEACLVPTGPT